MINSKYLKRLKEIVSTSDWGDGEKNFFFNVIRSLLKYIDYLHAQINHYQIIESHDKETTLEASKAWAVLTDKNYWDLREKNSAISEAEKIKDELLTSIRDYKITLQQLVVIQNTFLKHLGFESQFNNSKDKNFIYYRGPVSLYFLTYPRRWKLYYNDMEFENESLTELIKKIVELDDLYKK